MPPFVLIGVCVLVALSSIVAKSASAKKASPPPGETAMVDAKKDFLLNLSAFVISFTASKWNLHEIFVESHDLMMELTPSGQKSSFEVALYRPDIVFDSSSEPVLIPALERIACVLLFVLFVGLFRRVCGRVFAIVRLGCCIAFLSLIHI